MRNVLTGVEHGRQGSSWTEDVVRAATDEASDQSRVDGGRTALHRRATARDGEADAQRNVNLEHGRPQEGLWP